jgi:ATP-dependent RNA helicase RhlE
MSIVCGEEVEYLEDIEKLIKKNIEVVSIDGFTLPRLKKVKMVKKQNNRGRNQNPRSNDRPKNNNKRNLKKNDSRSENFKKDDRNFTRPKAKKDNFKGQVDDFMKSRRESKAKSNRRVTSDSKSRGSSQRGR